MGQIWKRAESQFFCSQLYNDEEELWLAISNAWIEMRENIDYATNLVNYSNE